MLAVKKNTPVKQYVELHNGGYYVAGTRVGLDVLIHDFRNGRSAEAILEAYPSIGPLAKVYGAITFILEHPAEIGDYLKAQDDRYEDIKRRHPLPPELIDRFERGRKQPSIKGG